MQGLDFGMAAIREIAVADLEFDTARVEHCVVERLLDDLDEALVQELLSRQVDRHGQVGHLEATLPAGQLPAGRCDDPLPG